MKILTSIAMAGLVTVSQMWGQSMGDSARVRPLSPPLPVEHDSTRSQVLTVVSVASAAAALGSVVLAYRYMARADAAYQRYLDAGDPTRMNRHFSQAQNYDRKAGISLAMFEVCLAITVYSTFSSLTP